MTRAQIEARHRNNHTAYLHHAPRDCELCRMDLRNCQGSKRYETPFAAEAAVRTNGDGFVWFKCRWCDGFHIRERASEGRRRHLDRKDQRHVEAMRERWRDRS